MTAVVLVARRHASYHDIPGQRYHFPRRRYEAQLRRAAGGVALIYEPRRGGSARESSGGGAQAFVAWAMLGEIEDDPDAVDHAYVRYTIYQEFPQSVSLSSVPISGKALQWAVLAIEDSVAEQILLAGLEPLLVGVPDAEGLTPRDIPPEIRKRPVEEIARNEVVRDRAFRYRVIEQAYEGRCAMTGLRLTNGHGRAEVDAAHIVPVSQGGPDTTSNGLALTKTLHWAFDRGLVSVENSGQLLVVERGFPDDLRTLLNRDQLILKPLRVSDAPHPVFLEWHRKNVFKGQATD